ncbi:MAG: hypothetical protein IT423_05435, partial [Pirellulaceae bacterium]|nr:hypothetical protein [Pirellulaceae bacterium]
MNKCLRNQWLTGWLATFCCLSFSASVFAQSSSKPTGNRQPARSTARPAPRPTAPQATNARPVQPMPAPALPGITQKPVSVLEANARPAQSAATNGAGQAKAGMFVLQHRLRPGNVVRTRTIHQANTVTRIQGTEDVSESNTVSDKVWDVKSLSPEGLMTFEYRIDAVDMSQKQSNKPEITYNSRTDKTAPEMFSRVAETISKPIAMVTIDATGKVIERDNQSKTPALGMGELAIPLPKDPVAIGAQWSIPRETRVKLEDGTHKTMKLREQYTLEKVSAGVATIKVETTP